MDDTSILGKRLPIEDCVIWAGSKNNKGYGNQRINGKCEKAHRVSYRNHYGEFDKKLHVLHRCDNPSCINPKHLFLGTHADNMRDRSLKGRTAKPDTKGEKNGQSKLSFRAVKMIRQFLYQKVPGVELAKAYGISTAQISRIKNNKKWVVKS